MKPPNPTGPGKKYRCTRSFSKVIACKILKPFRSEEGRFGTYGVPDWEVILRWCLPPGYN